MFSPKIKSSYKKLSSFKGTLTYKHLIEISIFKNPFRILSANKAILTQSYQNWLIYKCTQRKCVVYWWPSRHKSGVLWRILSYPENSRLWMDWNSGVRVDTVSRGLLYRYIGIHLSVCLAVGIVLHCGRPRPLYQCLTLSIHNLYCERLGTFCTTLTNMYVWIFNF